jgi:adenylate cyclase, class 2
VKTKAEEKRGTEVEIKLPVPDANAMRRKLRRAGARPLPDKLAGGQGRVHERNTLYDTPQGGFARHGQLLRIRVETSPGLNKAPSSASQAERVRAWITYKGPVETRSTAELERHQRYKVRREIEAQVCGVTALGEILEALGLRGWFRYEKFRSTFRFPTKQAWAEGLVLALDETPIGTYLELEGPSKAIDNAARLLGYTPADYIRKDYLALHVEACHKQGHSIPERAPGVVTGIPDMVFPQKNPR